MNEFYFWSDSKVVLKYIKNCNTRFNVYVSHRINEILNNSKTDEWHYIQTKLNPADECTRPVKPVKYNSKSNYLVGPSFLREVDIKGYTNEVVSNELNAIVITNTISSKKEVFVVWERYSSWLKLIRVIAYVIVIFKHWSSLNHSQSPEFVSCLNAKHLLQSTRITLKTIQNELFVNEFNSLQYNRDVNNKKMLQLQPIIMNNLICVGGRLKHCNVPENFKHQIILPNHHVVKLLVQHLHEENHHCGREQLMSTVREKFWIINGRAVIRDVINNCLICKRRRIKPQTHLMAELPAERTSFDEAAFTFTGVDYFGRITIKQSKKTRSTKGMDKRYGVVFTCLTFRAVHLKVAGDLSTDSFIMALKRFIARRGRPRTI